MKKILAIAGNEILLLFRRKVGWGLIALCVGLATFMFFFARGDGQLLNELKIRVRYSLYFFTGLLNLALMYLACISLRKEIDTRRFHTLAAAPVHRGQIWLGKLVGLVAFGGAVFLAASAAIAICCSLYIRSWPDGEEKNRLNATFLRAFHAQNPRLPSIGGLVEREYKRMQLKGTLPKDQPESLIKQDLYDKIRRREQLIKPGATKTWTFDWNRRSVDGDHLVLKFKFYCEDNRREIRGDWSLSAPDQSGGWSAPFKGYPYQFHELKIPANQVPRGDVLSLTFAGKGTPYLIFPRINGVSLLYDDGGILSNFSRLFLCSLLHFASLVALSLTLCSFFSYSVAVFVNMVVYGVGSASGFFTSVVSDLAHPVAHSDGGSVMKFFSVFIHLGLWLSQGVKAPPVIERFSEGLSIPLLELAVTWGPGFIVYTGLATLLGVVVLTRKEIDRELRT